MCPRLAQGVVLNLRVDTDVTRALGVENHVCEVQLLLKSFAYMQVCCQGSCPDHVAGVQLKCEKPGGEF